MNGKSVRLERFPEQDRVIKFGVNKHDHWTVNEVEVPTDFGAVLDWFVFRESSWRFIQFVIRHATPWGPGTVLTRYSRERLYRVWRWVGEHFEYS